MFASALAVLAAASPTVDAQVVDRAGAVVGPRTVAVRALHVRSGGRTCRLRAGLPIGVLRALRVSFRAEGSCSSLYVPEARGQRERGAGGWVYKVGRRLPGVSASASSARLRGGEQVTWFWCTTAGRCQRTLDVSVSTTSGTLRAIVTGYDDRGRGARVGGATVGVRDRTTGGLRTLRTGPDGTLVTSVVTGRRYRVSARRAGMIPAFPEQVTG